MAKNDLNSEGKKKLEASDLISKIDEFKEKEMKISLKELYEINNKWYNEYYGSFNKRN